MSANHTVSKKTIRRFDVTCPNRVVSIAAALREVSAGARLLSAETESVDSFDNRVIYDLVRLHFEIESETE